MCVLRVRSFIWIREREGMQTASTRDATDAEREKRGKDANESTHAERDREPSTAFPNGNRGKRRRQKKRTESLEKSSNHSVRAIQWTQHSLLEHQTRGWRRWRSRIESSFQGCPCHFRLFSKVPEKVENMCLLSLLFHTSFLGLERLSSFRLSLTSRRMMSF